MCIKLHSNQYCLYDFFRMPGLTNNLAYPSLSILSIFHNFKFTEASLILFNRDWSHQQQLIDFANWWKDFFFFKVKFAMSCSDCNKCVIIILHCKKIPTLPINFQTQQDLLLVDTFFHYFHAWLSLEVAVNSQRGHIYLMQQLNFISIFDDRWVRHPDRILGMIFQQLS